MKDTRNRWVAEAVAILVPVLVIASPFLFTSRSLAGREFQAFFRSRAVYAQEMTSRDGEWPRWNGRQYAGTPLLGDLQGSLHYPPNLLYLAVAPERAFGFLFVFHMIVAGMGMYRLSRYFEFRRSASVLGGVAYGVSFSVAANMSAGTLAPFVTQALAPWVLLLILRMVKRASMIRLVLLAVAFGGILLGGNPQDVPFVLLLSAGLIWWTAVDAGRRKRPWRGSSAVLTAVSALLGTALAFASIYPALEVRIFAAPTVAGPRDWRVLYVGVLPAVLAVLPFQNPRRGPTLFFAVSGLAALLIPGGSLWVFALSLSGLAAAGWDGLARGRYPARTVLRMLGVLGILAVIGAGVVFWRFRIAGDAAILLGLLGISAATVTKLRSHPRAIVAAILIIAVDLCYFDARAIRTLSPEEYGAPPWYAASIGPERHEYRLYDTTTTDAAPAASGFRLLNGYGYPRLGHFQPTMESLEDLNVRWLISTAAPPSVRWKEVARREDRILYENPQTRRSAYLLASDDELGPPLKILRTANSIEVAGRTYQAGMLAVSESWMPGWKAYMARREVAVLKGEHMLLNVDVPAGDWYVTLRYEPESFRTGRIVSSSAVALLIGLLVAGMKRSKIAIS